MLGGLDFYGPDYIDSLVSCSQDKLKIPYPPRKEGGHE